MDSGKQLSIRLDNLQAIYLQRLAKESGRAQGQVLQRLIVYAVNSPDALKALGIWDWQNNKAKDIKL